MKKERDKYFSYYKEGNFLRYKQFSLERDILRVAYYIFEAEKIIKRNKTLTQINIPLSEATFDNINLQRLKELLS